MSLESFKEHVDHPLRQTTWCTVIRDGEILLGMKKRGFGEGKWNGFGGKPHNGEPIEAAAIREMQEESLILPYNLGRVATLNFYFPHIPIEDDFNQQVLVYFTDEWHGDPGETEEMIPQWFRFADIPYDQMWSDDVIWLPRVLNGEIIEADFAFDQHQEVEEYSLKSL